MSAVQNAYSNNYFSQEDDEEDYIEDNSPEVESSQKDDVNHLREELKRKEQAIYEAEQTAQESTRRANETLSELHRIQGSYLTQERERTAQRIARLEIDLNSASENADSAMSTKLTTELISERVRLSDLSKGGNPTVSTQSPQSVPVDNYDTLISSNLTSEQRRFLEERPELKDQKKYNTFKHIMDMVNRENIYVSGTSPWLKEVDRRLELNEIYESPKKRSETGGKTRDPDMNRQDYDRQNSRKDQDDYRGREGRPNRERETGPMSMPKGESSSDHSHRVSPNGARLTEEQRKFSRSMGMKDAQYAMGVGYLDYAMKKGLAKEHRGGLTVTMGDDFREYTDMVNSQKQRRR